MRKSIAYILFFLLMACHGAVNNYMDTKVVEVKMADSLGVVSMSVPVLYDSNFSWTDHSDCGKPCDKIKYRFQPKGLPVFEESGFFYASLKDSINQVTISHSGYHPFFGNADSSYIFRFHPIKKAAALQDPATIKIKNDTIEKIGDRYFSIITIDLYDSVTSQYSKKVLATTTIKANTIDFNYELLTKQKNAISDNFIENSMRLLRTVRINNKP